MGCSPSHTTGAITLPGRPSSVDLGVTGVKTMVATIAPPLNDGGAVIVRYEVASRTVYPGQAVGEVQNIPTKGARDFEYFSIGNQHFLSVANHKSGASYDQNSIVYKYDATRSANPFQVLQSIPSKGADHWTYFNISDQHFLTVANFYDGSSWDQKSIVYKYDATRTTNPF